MPIAKVIQYRDRKAVEHHVHDFRWNEHPDGGYSFDCDEAGALLDENHRDRLIWACLNDDLHYNGIRTYITHETVPLIVECPKCGKPVEFWIPGGDVEHDCGQWFNCFGQMLRNPHPVYGWDDEGMDY